MRGCIGPLLYLGLERQPQRNPARCVAPVCGQRLAVDCSVYPPTFEELVVGMISEKTEYRITGWGGVLLGAIALIGLPTLSVWFRGLTRPVNLPLWAFLSAVLLLATVALLSYRTVTHRSAEVRRGFEEEEATWMAEAAQLGGTCDDLAEENRQLVASLHDKNALVFERGAYFRRTDTSHQQPFCRVCYDREQLLITVTESTEWDDKERDWVGVYFCPECGETHLMRILHDVGNATTDVDDEA